MQGRYDIFEFISQRKDGEMPQENEELIGIVDYIRRATEDCSKDEEQSGKGNGDVINQNEKEKRIAEKWSKANSSWLPMENIFLLGVPGPSGSESDTYVSKDSLIYKCNNLLHCSDSIVIALQKYLLFNIIFPDSAYAFYCFTGFEGRSIYPVFKQHYVQGDPATQNEIDCYMAAIGFEKIDKGKFENNFCTVWDILPKNVLKDSSGDVFVIDSEIALRNNKITTTN